MHIIYLDHSGDQDDADQHHFVLAGISVFERQTHWLSQAVDQVAARFNAADPQAIEIHASPMRSGRDRWRKYAVKDRIQALVDCYKIIASSIDSTVLFGAAIEKSPAVVDDVVSSAFEHVCSRFDSHLKRLHKSRNTQRGIIVFDEASYERTIQNLATDFKNIGRSWGVTHNLSEVPLFLDSKASRLVQLADLVAFAIYRNVEKADSQFYDIISHRFDRQGSSARGFFYKPANPPPFKLEP
jgi:hypothetical protein